MFQALASAFPFEVAVGLNGTVWVNSASAKHTIVVCNAITGSEHQDDAAVHALCKSLLRAAAA